MRVIKAQAYGNDFILVESDFSTTVDGAAERADLARRLCARHTGIGADGLIFVSLTERGASTRLLNADGSRSEISGNGIRCVAAWLAREWRTAPGATIVIETEAGDYDVRILGRRGMRVECRAAMGIPRDVHKEVIQVAGQAVCCVLLNMGNPQCVVLGDRESVNLTYLQTVAAGLSTHERFREGTNVELATVEAPGLVRMLIWERGVGPTESSGTGACAAAVAAVRFAGAQSPVDVVAPGGTQRVEVTPEGVWLSGWAEVVGLIEWWGES